MTTSADSIPLPTRPGTVCKWDDEKVRRLGVHVCVHCGKGWNAHGAPEDVAQSLGIPIAERGAICPASDEAWEAFRAERRRANLDDFVAHFVGELRKLTPAERLIALSRVCDEAGAP